MYLKVLSLQSRPVLESKDMRVIFPERAKKDKKGKIFENLGKNVKKLKIF